MKKFLYLFFASLAALPCLQSCDDDSEYDAVYVNLSSDVPYTTITKENGKQYKYRFLSGGFNYRFTVRANELKKGQLSRLTLKTFDRERSEVCIFDKVISGKDYAEDFVYTAPDNLSTDTLAITFILTGYNTSGETCHMEYVYTLVQEDAALTAIQGITMYTQEGDDRPNGYSFTRQLPIRTSLSEDEEIDIYAYVDEESPDILTFEWRTENGIYFVKNNNFDFAKATRKSVTTAYKASVSYHIVNNLQANDVILVGNDKEALGVIKIQNIYDENGSNLDRYYFDFKPIRNK